MLSGRPSSSAILDRAGTTGEHLHFVRLRLLRSFVVNSVLFVPSSISLRELLGLFPGGFGAQALGSPLDPARQLSLGLQCTQRRL